VKIYVAGYNVLDN